RRYHRVAQQQFTGLTRAEIPAVVAGDPDLVDGAERRMLARRAQGAERAGAAGPDQPVRALRHGVPDHDAQAEPAFHLLLALPGRRRAGVTEPQRRVRVVGLRRLAPED